MAQKLDPKQTASWEEIAYTNMLQLETLTRLPIVDVKPVTTDRYGRTVGLIYIKGKYLSEELIMAGYGWV